MKKLAIYTCTFLLGILPLYTFSQPLTDYDNDLLPAAFHRSRREALRSKMEPNSVAVIFSNPVRNRSNDVDYKYSQNPDFYYLSGLTEPDAVLLIFSESITIDSISCRELIFVQPRNPLFESWTGRRMGTDGVKKELGFEYVFENYHFQNLNLSFDKFSFIYHPVLHNDVRNDNQDEGDLYSLIKVFNEKTDKLEHKKSSFTFSNKMAELREIKTDDELKLLRKAIGITCDAHLELMKTLEVGMSEYQAQAIVEFGFTFNGSEYTGYPSIVGGGENSCVLHYISNRKKLNNPDFLVIDAGAEYHGYTADVTRTLPVSGKFSIEQKEIYNLVLEAQLAGIKECKEGNAFRDPHNAAVEVIKKGLIRLGIIKSPNEFMKYFFHGTSHYLGLDVHDPGSYGKFKNGQVITVEPGIYIAEGSACDKKWWNIGVRIEDDVLINGNAPEVLSQKLPKTIDEIEKIMADPGFLKKN